MRVQLRGLSTTFIMTFSSLKRPALGVTPREWHRIATVGKQQLHAQQASTLNNADVLEVVNGELLTFQDHNLASEAFISIRTLIIN